MSILPELKDTHRQFFFPDIDRFGSNTPWSAQWQNHTGMTMEEVLATIDAHDAGYDEVVLIVNSEPIEVSPAAATRLAFIAHFGHDLVGTQEEAYDLYFVAPRMVP
jgi:hypothetical protein